MKKFENGKSANKHVNELFKLMYEKNITDFEKVAKILAKKHEDDPEYDEYEVIDDAIMFLEDDIGNYDVVDTDLEKCTEDRAGTTYVADGIYADWSYTHSPYFSAYKSWTTFCYKGEISFHTDEEKAEETNEAAEKFTKKFLKEHPNISLEDAIKEVYKELKK